MACPFCSIMLKGAQASAGKSGAAGAADQPMAMTDLMPDAPAAASPPERSGEPLS